jgi:DNA-binding LacI/PurR family transcriptional regulator
MIKQDKIESNARKRVTLKDIGRQLELSHATVSRALNGMPDGLISQATIERVRRVALEMGYRPNHAARSLATGRTGLLALWIWSEELHSSYHAAVSQRMHLEAVNHSYQLLVDLVDRPVLGLPKTSAFDSWNVDGIIAHEASPAIEKQFGATRPPTPIVATGAYQLLEGVDEVRVDLSEGAREAMKHLFALGRRRVAYLTDDLQGRTFDPRYIAYTEGMEASGRPCEFIETSGTRRASRERIRAYVADQGCPEAIICHNDDLAIGAYRGLLDMGLRIPENVALVGCDGIEDGEYLEAPLTTIAQPLEHLCSLATQFLDKRIADPTRPIQRALLKAQLIVRDSTVPSS